MCSLSPLLAQLPSLHALERPPASLLALLPASLIGQCPQRVGSYDKPLASLFLGCFLLCPGLSDILGSDCASVPHFRCGQPASWSSQRALLQGSSGHALCRSCSSSLCSLFLYDLLAPPCWHCCSSLAAGWPSISSVCCVFFAESAFFSPPRCGPPFRSPPHICSGHCIGTRGSGCVCLLLGLLASACFKLSAGLGGRGHYCPHHTDQFCCNSPCLAGALTPSNFLQDVQEKEGLQTSSAA